MSVVYSQAQKQRYRITLELDVLGDFNPHQLDWEKLFKLEPAEHCEAYVEDLSTPDRWWFESKIGEKVLSQNCIDIGGILGQNYET